MKPTNQTNLRTDEDYKSVKCLLKWRCNPVDVQLAYDKLYEQYSLGKFQYIATSGSQVLLAGVQGQSEVDQFLKSANLFNPQTRLDRVSPPPLENIQEESPSTGVETSTPVSISSYLHNVLSSAEYTQAIKLVRSSREEIEGKFVKLSVNGKNGHVIAGKQEEFKEWLRKQDGYEFNFRGERKVETEEDFAEWYSRNSIVKQLGYEPSGPASVFIGELVEKGTIPAKYIKKTSGHYKISSEALDSIDKHLAKEGYRKVTKSNIPASLPVHEEVDKKTLPGLSLDRLLEKIGAKKGAKERIISMIEGEKKDYAILPYFRKRNGEYELISGADLVLTEAARELVPKLDSLKLLG